MDIFYHPRAFPLPPPVSMLSGSDFEGARTPHALCHSSIQGFMPCCTT